jgi:hypothetical protein
MLIQPQEKCETGTQNSSTNRGGTTSYAIDVARIPSTGGGAVVLTDDVTTNTYIKAWR